MTDRKLFVVGNPKSGSGKMAKIVTLLKQVLSQKPLAYQFFETTIESNAWQTVQRNLDASFTDLIVIGGDGTLNEAINGLKHDIPVSIIPAGTGNDFVKCLQLGKTLRDQIQTALYGKAFTIDIGYCNDRKFINGVGVGFDGQIVADLLTQKTILKGVFKYYYHVLKILSSYKPRVFDYSLDSTSKVDQLILMCIAKGTTFGGGFRLTPNARLANGKLEVCLIGHVSPVQRFLNIHRLQGGSHGVMEEISFEQVEELLIKENPALEAHIDGEYLGNPPFRFRVGQGALQVRAKGLRS